MFKCMYGTIKMYVCMTSMNEKLYECMQSSHEHQLVFQKKNKEKKVMNNFILKAMKQALKIQIAIYIL